MQLPVQGCLLRVIIGEAARHEGKLLYEWIVLRAREHGLAGATVLRGMMGFGASSRIRTGSILCLSQDLPVVIELVDSREKIENFLDLIDPVLPEGVVTLEEVQVRLYRHKGADPAGQPSDQSTA